MNIKRFIPLILVIVILSGVILVSSQKNNNSDKTKITENAFTSTADILTENDELKGVWISYIELSMENESDKSENSFRNKFTDIAICCKENEFNTLIVQVRPFCDALYKSKLFPYSHILTGVQGKNPGYDPLKIMCEICKDNGLQIHAWVNPYRISTQNTPQSLSKDNPYLLDKSIGFETKGGVYLDPSSAKAQELIIEGTAEIVENYDVDAIQFDDYFYPPDMGNEDSSSYNEYLKNCKSKNAMSLEQWRKENVNMLVCNTYRKIHSIKRNVEFGISPQGNIDNNESIYADVKKWCTTNGFIDYICPQIYFSLDNPALSFKESLDSWNTLNFAKSVKLYVGLAGYKAGTDKDENTWLNANNILSSEYEIIKSKSKAQGFMLYSYNSLISEVSSNEIKNLTDSLK